MKSGYSLLLTEETFTKRLLKGFESEKLLPVPDTPKFIYDRQSFTEKETF